MTIQTIVSKERVLEALKQIIEDAAKKGNYSIDEIGEENDTYILESTHEQAETITKGILHKTQIPIIKKIKKSAITIHLDKSKNPKVWAILSHTQNSDQIAATIATEFSKYTNLNINLGLYNLTNNQTSKTYCGYCGRTSNQNVTACEHCGAPLKPLFTS